MANMAIRSTSYRLLTSLQHKPRVHSPELCDLQCLQTEYRCQFLICDIWIRAQHFQHRRKFFFPVFICFRGKRIGLLYRNFWQFWIYRRWYCFSYGIILSYRRILACWYLDIIQPIDNLVDQNQISIVGRDFYRAIFNAILDHSSRMTSRIYQGKYRNRDTASRARSEERRVGKEWR